MQQLFEKQPSLQGEFLAFAKQKEDGIQLVDMENLKEMIRRRFEDIRFLSSTKPAYHYSYPEIQSFIKEIFREYLDYIWEHLHNDRATDALRVILAIYEVSSSVKKFKYDEIGMIEKTSDELFPRFYSMLNDFSEAMNSSILSTPYSKQMLKLIFERWDKFEARPGDIVYEWRVFVPLIKALTADKVVAHYLKTLLDTYSLTGTDVADLHSHIARLAGED